MGRKECLTDEMKEKLLKIDWSNDTITRVSKTIGVSTKPVRAFLRKNNISHMREMKTTCTRDSFGRFLIFDKKEKEAIDDNDDNPFADYQFLNETLST